MDSNIHDEGLEDERKKLYDEYDALLVDWKKKEIKAFEFGQYLQWKREKNADETIPEAEMQKYKTLSQERHKAEEKAELKREKIKYIEERQGKNQDPFENTEMLPKYYGLDEIAYARQVMKDYFG